eukprot:TRINITY_DN6847_c0_g1_i9.p1 TRINITY_DN6847_c0_g1~~TRINITY_DN6847_c0_g1_i9.p1  ORF type:complete len:1428 (+),score=247.11 TRINITY_DN6847_c0_g1_i9:76-4284(+)
MDISLVRHASDVADSGDDGADVQTNDDYIDTLEQLVKERHVPQAVLAVYGAADDGFRHCNGEYAVDGEHLGRPLYKKIHGTALILYDKGWKMLDERDLEKQRWMYVGGGQGGAELFGEWEHGNADTKVACPFVSNARLAVCGDRDPEFNGDYKVDGEHSGRALYKQEGGDAIIYFKAGAWRMNNHGEKIDPGVYVGPNSGKKLIGEWGLPSGESPTRLYVSQKQIPITLCELGHCVRPSAHSFSLTCNVCKKYIAVGTRVLSCKSCKFFVCQTCQSPDNHLQASQRKELSTRSKVKLCYLWASMRSRHVVEIWMLVCLMFYVDFGLDIRMLFTFYEYGDYKFIAVSILGILLGTFFTLVEMVKVVDEDDPPWMLLICGFLLPFGLHVLFLSGYSTLKGGGVHPLLHTFKLSEACIEGTVSSLVQTYALIFRNMAWEDKVVGYISNSSSYFSIAWAVTQFDIRSKGLSGLPGMATGCRDWRLWIVFVFRVCEIVSRVISLGIFQLALRDEIIFVEKPFGILPQGFGTMGGATMVFIDFVVMFILTIFFQWTNLSNLPYSMLSSIVFTNPILLDTNAFTIPAWLYFSIRFVELMVMGGLVREFGVHEKIMNDMVLVYALCTCTAVGAVLLMIIRCCRVAGHVMLSEEEAAEELYVSHSFCKTEDRLLKEIMDNSELAPKFDEKCDKLFRRAEHSLRNANPTKTKACAERARSSASGFFQVLYNWLDEEYTNMLHVAEERKSLGERFTELVYIGYNLNCWLQANHSSLCRAQSHADRYVLLQEADEGGDSEDTQWKLTRRVQSFADYLSTLNSVCNKPVVVDRLTEQHIAQNLLRVIPESRPWHGASAQRQRQELRLFEEKCNLVSHVLRAGWQHGKAFIPLAKKFHELFDCLTSEEISKRVIKDDRDSTVDPFDWLVRVQSHALVTMWTEIPDHTKDDSEVMKDLFRPPKEVAALMLGLETIMRGREKKVVGTLGPTISNKDMWTKAIKCVFKAVYNPDLLVKPARKPQDVSNRRDVDAYLQILTSSQETLRLVQIGIVDSAEETQFDITNKEDLRLRLCADNDGNSNLPYGETQLKFYFRRVREIENESLARLKEHKWTIHQTIPLRIFRSIHFYHLTNQFNLRKGDEMYNIYDRYRQVVEAEVTSAINDKHDLLKMEAATTVNVETAGGRARTYREHSHSLSLQNLSPCPQELDRIKKIMNKEMSKYEEHHDRVKAYIETVREEFKWSRKIVSLCETLLETDEASQTRHSLGAKGLNNELKVLRESNQRFFSREDKHMHNATEAKADQARREKDFEKKKGHLAKIQEGAAKEEAEGAKEALEEANNKLRNVTRELELAYQGLKEEEKKSRKATLALQQAEERRNEEVESYRRTLSELKEKMAEVKSRDTPVEWAEILLTKVL